MLTTKPWTGNGNPVDDPIATRYYCVGAAERTALICASTDDDDKPRSCGSGYSFNADDCCERDTSALEEQLVGPNRTSAISLGNWATGADVARASEVVEYRLTGNNGGQCTGSSSWAAFSGLTVGVFGEAAMGQVTASCSYAFRYEDSHESIGSSRIQLSTQASSQILDMPGQMN